MTTKQIGKEAKYIDEVQADALISAIETAEELHRTIVRLLLFTEMRRDEVFGLKWSDIDFKKGTLKICRTIQYLPEIPFITLHSLRHTNATLQLAAEKIEDIFSKQKTKAAVYRTKPLPSRQRFFHGFYSEVDSGKVKKASGRH